MLLNIAKQYSKAYKNIFKKIFALEKTAIFALVLLTLPSNVR